MRMTGTLLWLMTLTAPASAGDAVGRVTLQVRAEPGYDAMSVTRILSDGSYLGSVQPGLIAQTDWQQDGELTSGISVLSANAAGNEILTLSFRGSDAATVRQHLSKLVENLTGLVPSSRAEILQDLKTAEQALDLATEESERMRMRLKMFVETNGAVEPTTWLNTLRSSLMNRSHELEKLDLDTAGERALRDYLVATIAETPQFLELAQNSKDLVDAKILLDRLKEDLKEARSHQKETHPDIAQLTSKMKDAEDRLESRQANAVNMIPNHRHQKLEMELFDVERKLALVESRRTELGKAVDGMRAEAKRLALVESEWRDLREQVGNAENRLFSTRQQVDQAKARARRALASEWAAVVAGPTFEG